MREAAGSGTNNSGKRREREGERITRARGEKEREKKEINLMALESLNLVITDSTLILTHLQLVALNDRYFLNTCYT